METVLFRVGINEYVNFIDPISRNSSRCEEKVPTKMNKYNKNLKGE